MSNWRLTVGMEVHVELQTKTKMFCGCKNDPFHSKPNTNVCPVCYGLPGALPVANKKAVEDTIKLGQALKGKIAKSTFWARKNYFYPDLPKGYQISQSTAPLVGEATLTIDGVDHKIERIHLEEDAGKLMHSSDKTHSLVNYNRAGVPLMELVTHPDLNSAESAKKFCKELQSVLRKLDISQADMEKGLMRCEANISVSKTDKFGTKVEVKNINSFKAVEKAIQYEYDRQVRALENGEKLVQETRTWDMDNNKTVVMRSKETSADYRYFPEPDLPYVETITVEGETHKLPDEMRRELVKLGVSIDMAQIAVSKGLQDLLIDFSQEILARGVNIKLNDIAFYLNKFKGFIHLSNRSVGEALDVVMITKKNGWGANALIEFVDEVNRTGMPPINLYENNNMSFDEDLSEIVNEIISENPDLVEKYKAGKDSVINALVGQVMKKTQGRANVANARAELEKQLKA